MDMAKVKLYRDLRDEQKRLEGEAEGIKARANEIERELVEEFSDEGVQNVKIDGSTVFLRRELWAQKEQGVSSDDVVEALREAGLGDFVALGYNSSALSARLRELDADDAPLPAALVGVVKVAEVFKIRYQKSR